MEEDEGYLARVEAKGEAGPHGLHTIYSRPVTTAYGLFTALYKRRRRFANADSPSRIELSRNNFLESRSRSLSLSLSLTRAMRPPRTRTDPYQSRCPSRLRVSPRLFSERLFAVEFAQRSTSSASDPLRKRSFAHASLTAASYRGFVVARDAPRARASEDARRRHFATSPGSLRKILAHVQP